MSSTITPSVLPPEKRFVSWADEVEADDDDFLGNFKARREEPVIKPQTSTTTPVRGYRQRRRASQGESPASTATADTSKDVSATNPTSTTTLATVHATSPSTVSPQVMPTPNYSDIATPPVARSMSPARIVAELRRHVACFPLQGIALEELELRADWVSTYSTTHGDLHEFILAHPTDLEVDAELQVRLPKAKEDDIFSSLLDFSATPLKF